MFFINERYIEIVSLADSFAYKFALSCDIVDYIVIRAISDKKILFYYVSNIFNSSHDFLL